MNADRESWAISSLYFNASLTDLKLHESTWFAVEELCSSIFVCGVSITAIASASMSLASLFLCPTVFEDFVILAIELAFLTFLLFFLVFFVDMSIFAFCFMAFLCIRGCEVWLSVCGGCLNIM